MATESNMISKSIDQEKLENDAVDDGISSASSSDFTEADQQRNSPENESPEVSTSEWEDILGSNDLKRKVLKQGATGDTKAVAGDLITLRVEGQLEDGTAVDCCEKLSFLLGHSEVIAAFELCVPFMKVGEVDALQAPARFAYGKVGKENEIPPHATVSYVVELLSVESGPSFDKMDADELLAWVHKKRERGNYYFKREEFASAIDVYNKAMSHLEFEPTKNDEERQRIVDARVTLYNNLAAAQIKVEAWNAAVSSLRYCTSFQPRNVKAHFRLGKAYAGQKEYQSAIDAFKIALALDADNKAIQREIELTKMMMKSENERSKAIYKRMFTGGQSTPDAKGRSFVEWWRRHGILTNASVLAVVAITAGAAIRYFASPKA